MSRHDRCHQISSPLGEEKMALLDEKSGSDMDSEIGDRSHDLGVKFDVFQLPAVLERPLDIVLSTSWRMLVGRSLLFLVPSFLQGRHAREQIRPTKVAPTAYLDGIRGLAALFVYFCHYSYQSFTIAKGWGLDENNLHILKLPFLRLFYQGPPAVSMFFVISGYALSYKALKSARSHKWAESSVGLSSLIFRRFLRLYMPSAISMMMICVFLQLGLYEYTRDFALDPAYMKNVIEPHPKPKDTPQLQLVEWTSQMYKYMHFFSWDEYGGQPSLDVHLWTIPIEFRCSLYLFLTIIGTARLQTKYRWICVISIVYFTYLKSRWDLALFLSGMLIAELDLMRGAHDTIFVLPFEEGTTVLRQGRSISSLFWGLMSVVGLYLMCQPDDGGQETPGWIYLSSLIPDWWTSEKYRYWQSIGAICFVVACSRSISLQAFFNSFPMQYLGKISYALYLMHGPATHCIGYHFERWAYSCTGLSGYWYNAGFFLGAVFCIPTVLWWSDLFWRAIDIPTVKFARWFEQKLLAE